MSPSSPSYFALSKQIQSSPPSFNAMPGYQALKSPRILDTMLRYTSPFWSVKTLNVTAQGDHNLVENKCKSATLPTPLRFFCTNIHVSSSVKRCTFWKLRPNCRSSFTFKTYLLVINVHLQRKPTSARTKGILAAMAVSLICTWLRHSCYGLRVKCGVYLPG